VRIGSLQRLVDSAPFNTTILTIIIANAVVLGMQTYDGVLDRWGDQLDFLNALFLAVFVVELVLRIASYGRRPQDFFRSGWNTFDFVVISAAFIPGVRESSTLLRLARLGRVVRVVRFLPHVRVLIVGVLRSLPPLISMALLTTLILFVYGMVGWLLFADELPEDWGNIGEAMLTMFVLLTLENFPVYMERGMEVHPWSWVFFVSFILVAAFIVLNVLIGIVLNSMEEAREIERRRALGIGVGKGPPAPVAERIAILRAALDELEQELGEAVGRAGGDVGKRTS
jgi:voltage-gated sodium channel